MDNKAIGASAWAAYQTALVASMSVCAACTARDAFLQQIMQEHYAACVAKAKTLRVNTKFVLDASGAIDPDVRELGKVVEAMIRVSEQAGEDINAKATEMLHAMCGRDAAGLRVSVSTRRNYPLFTIEKEG